MIAYERNECMIKKQSCFYYQCSKPTTVNRSATSKKLIFEPEIMETIKSSSNGKQLKSISIDHAAISLFTPLAEIRINSSTTVGWPFFVNFFGAIST